jgi:hypothetical protein
MSRMHKRCGLRMEGDEHFSETSLRSRENTVAPEFALCQRPVSLLLGSLRSLLYYSFLIFNGRQELYGLDCTLP